LKEAMKNSETPLVSVIMPVYNAEAYLHEALESIFSQDYRPIEVVVVDDGSTDGSRDIIRAFPEIRYLYQENSGHARARNRGIREATGTFLAFLDADDLWMPGKLALQMSAFRTDPDLELVTGHGCQFLSPELENAAGRVEENISSDPLPGYSTIAILARRELFAKVGCFLETDQSVDTIDWFAKVKECNLKMKVFPDVVARRRIHMSNHSIRHRQEKNKTILRMLKASLDRRRAGA
jgi:glycosyltransferase involved in cell wall biosynthesis